MKKLIIIMALLTSCGKSDVLNSPTVSTSEPQSQAVMEKTDLEICNINCTTVLEKCNSSAQLAGQGHVEPNKSKLIQQELRNCTDRKTLCSEICNSCELQKWDQRISECKI